MAKRKVSPIRWLTRDQVEAAAYKSTRAALLCSIRHWEQLHQATPKQLTRALNDCLVEVYSKGCALCHRFGALAFNVTCQWGDEVCPVAVRYGRRCTPGSNGMWRYFAAKDALDDWQDAPYTQTAAVVKAKFSLWQEESGRVLAGLKALLKTVKETL